MLMKPCKITDGFNFLYLDDRGFPRWRDEEYATIFPNEIEANRVIWGCGYQHNLDEIKVVAAR